MRKANKSVTDTLLQFCIAADELIASPSKENLTNMQPFLEANTWAFLTKLKSSFQNRVWLNESFAPEIKSDSYSSPSAKTLGDSLAKVTNPESTKKRKKR